MSFILDALRKSEHERERRALPALIERPVTGRAPSKLPLVLGGLATLLVVNFIVLGIVLLRPGSAPPAAAPAGAAETHEPAAALPERVLPPSRTRPLDAEATDTEAEGSEPVPPPVAHAAADPSLTAPRSSLVTRSRPAAQLREESVRSINDLPQPVGAGLPHLNVDLHVFADTPAQRFVVINGQRLHEGDALREGPRLERITPDGVILTYRGTRFQVPRQQ